MAPARTSYPDGTPPALRAGLAHVPPIRTMPELHCELRSCGHEYALAALNAFVAPKYRFAANHEFVARSLDQAQRAFPEHVEAFTRLRAAYGIRSHLPTSSTSAITPLAVVPARRTAIRGLPPPPRDSEEQCHATSELHSRLRRCSHAEAVSALDDFLVDAVSDWTSQFAIISVDDAEHNFPEHAEAFAYIRSEWRLAPLARASGNSLPVTPTSPRSPASAPRPLSPASPRLGSSVLPGLRPPLLDAPPEYAKNDPDPSATRLLEETLAMAAAADGVHHTALGMTFLFPAAPLYHDTAAALPSLRASFDVGARDHHCDHDLDADVNMVSDDTDDVNAHGRCDGTDVWRATASAASSTGAGAGDVALLGGGVVLQRERNLSLATSGGCGPTYTFTAEQLAGIDAEPRRRARSEGPARRPVAPTASPQPEAAPDSHPPPRSQSRSQFHSDSHANPQPQTVSDPFGTLFPTYTFTADELAGVGEYRRNSLGWKQLLIPRRVSAPTPNDPQPSKLFRSMSRGEGRT